MACLSAKWANVYDFWEIKEHITLASETRFAVTCGDQQHTIIISTVHIPDPDNPKSGKTIPAPHLCLVSHCTCTAHEHGGHCSDHAEGCEGQSWLEAQMVYLKLAEVAEPSCAQWALEFVGTAPRRVEQSWWSIVQTPEKSSTIKA